MRTIYSCTIRGLAMANLMLFGVFAMSQTPKAKFSIQPVLGTDNFTFIDESDGAPTSYSWAFPGGTPATSTSVNPLIEYSTSGNYTATLIASNLNGVSTFKLDFTIGAGGDLVMVDLRTGRNNDGTLMPTTGVPDTDWTYTHPNTTVSTPITRHKYTGWYSAQLPPLNAQESVWITGDNTATGYHFYDSKSFTVPKGVTNAKINLRSLSFVRNWTYLVNEDDNTETLITQTTWMSDGAKGWLNSRSPLVENLSLSPGNYHIRVKVYTNNTSVRQSIDVNGYVEYNDADGFMVSDKADFVADVANANLGSPISFTNISSGAPVSFSWKFQDGSNEILSSVENPVIIFTELGFHDVELTVTYANGLSSTLKIEDYVETTTNLNMDYTLAPNSYIFDPYQDDYDGLYVPVKKAYDLWADENGYFDAPIGAGVLSASIIWQDVAGLIKSDPSTPADDFDLPLTGSNENTKIKLLVDKTKGKGNAVVAFKVNGEIKWSWHIWVTDIPEVGAENTVLEGWNKNLDDEFFAPTFMDRNLGATHNHFLGNEWNKSGGLMYEWGRKDPFPPLVYKDYTFYEVEGEVGIVKHKDSKSNNLLTMDNFTVERPFNDIGSNIKYSVENPFNYIYTANNSNWFSSANNLGPISGDTGFNQMFDLWGDNFGGKRGGYLPGHSNYEPYPMKSSFDPCPKGWRVPSYNGQQVTRNYFSPWGRNSSFNDDDGYAEIEANVNNVRVSGIKVYPGLGVDFSGVTNRTIGAYSLTGGFKQYGSGKPFFQDPFSESQIWTATSYNNSGRSMYIIADYARTDVSEFGLNTFYHVGSTATQTTQKAQAVRCIIDPNDSLLPDYSTEFILADTTKRNYKTGLDNPNSYIIEENQEELEIPIAKAFAIYNQYLTDREWPSGTLDTKVVWATNISLITKVSLENAVINNPDDGIIKVEFGSSNPKGNAVVALTINDEVLWSWHIWAPIDSPTANTITYTNEEAISTLNIVNPTKSGIAPLTTTFMDRNLGAMEAFPVVANPFSPTSIEISQIENSGGLHYQWGRKDPIPSFLKVGSGGYLIYLETGKDTNGNSIFGISVNSTDYLSNFTSDYSVYGAASSANRNLKIVQSLNYSVKNPLNFLFHTGTGSPNNYNQIKDWIADERNLADNRWGHADKKSPFDPCPNGWRVPDVSFTFLEQNTILLGSTIASGSIGSSPWYRNKILPGSAPEQNRHLVQNREYEVDANYYEGDWVEGYGWIFNDSNYKIGNFPATGIRGHVGNNTVSNQNTLSGVWTSSLSDTQYGYALGLFLSVNSANTKGLVKSGDGFYPQAGMNVRCALDEPRYNGGTPAEKNNSAEENTIIDQVEIAKTMTQSDFVYPNPVKDFLYINSNQNSDFIIYNLGGSIVLSGKFENSKINLTELLKGVYLIKILNENSNTEILKKIIKE